MGYQPIQVAWPNPANELDGLGDALSRLRTRDRDSQWKSFERANKAAETQDDRQRRRLIDFQNAYVQAHALAQKGDIAGAQSLLAPFVDTIEEVEQPGQPAAQGGSAIPDQLDNGRSMAKPYAPSAADVSGVDDILAGYNAPTAADVNGVDDIIRGYNAPPAKGIRDYLADAGKGADPDIQSRVMSVINGGNQYIDDTEARRVATQPAAPAPQVDAPAAQPQAPLLQRAAANPIEAARQADIRRAMMLRGVGPTGQQFTIDPEAQRRFAEQADTERRNRDADALGKAFGDDKYGKMAADLARATGDPERAMAVVRSIMERDTAASQRANERAEDRANRLADAEAQRRFQAGQNALSRAAMGERDARADAREARAAAKDQRDSDKESLSRAIFDPETGEKVGEAATPKGAESTNTGAAAIANMRRTIAELRESYAKGRVNPLGAEATRRNGLITDLKMDYKTLKELGQLAGPDQGLIEGALTKGGAIYAQDPVPALDTMEKVLGRSQKLKAAARGVRPTGTQRRAGGGAVDEADAWLNSLGGAK